jgi:hypothetical protein
MKKTETVRLENRAILDRRAVVGKDKGQPEGKSHLSLDLPVGQSPPAERELGGRTRMIPTRRGTSLLIGCLLMVWTVARGSTINGTLWNTGGNGLATNALFAPLSTPQADGTAIIASTATNVIANSVGAFTVVLKQGNYKVTIGNNAKDSFVIAVPNDSATYNLTALITSSLTYSYPVLPVYQTTADTDARLRQGRVWVVDSSYGNDAIATNGSYASKTLTNAKALAVWGDLIHVRPGNYTNNNLLKAGVNWDFMPGANVYWDVPTNTDAGYGIFDDRTSGATTNVISGWGTFQLRDSDPECPNLLGAISLTNARSELRVSGKALFYGSRSATYLSGISVRNCRVSDFNFQTVSDTYELWADDVPPPDTTYLTSQATGIYWENGEMHCHIDNNTASAGYALWSRDIGNSTNSLYYDGNLIASSNFVAVYVQGAATSQGTLRTWVNAKEIYSPQIGLSMLGSVKAYVTAQKISGGTGGVAIDASGELWAWVQKVSAGGTWVRKVPTTEPKPTPARIFALQYEALSESMTDGILNTSTNALFIVGGVMRGGTNQTRMVRQTGTGLTTLTGTTVDGTACANTNAPVLVSSGGLSFEGGRVLSGVAPLTLHATAAQVVDCQGLYRNKPMNPLITQSNGWSQASNTIYVVNNLAVTAPSGTNAIGIYQGPSLVGGFDGNGVAMLSVSNSAVVYPAGYEVWSQDVDGSDTNVINTLTSIFGTGSIGSRTLPQNFWKHGRNVVVDMEGSYWSSGSGGLTAVNGLFNGITLNASAVSLLSAQSGDNFVGHWVMNCRTNVGATNLISGGRMTFGSSTTMRFTNTVTLLTDPTAAGLIDIQTTNATASHSILLRTARITLY